MKKNTKLLLTLITITSLIFMPEINAATLAGGGECYYFNRSTGAYNSLKISSNYGKDCVKELTGETDVNGKPAYCVEWGKSIKTKNYQKDTSLDSKSKNAILAGIIIENINGDYSGTKAYGMTAAALNTYFSKKYSYAASKNFYSSNDTIKKYYDGAAKEYEDNGYTTSTTITKPSISGTRILDYNSSGKYYMSKAITATLTKEYGGDPVTYTISANKSATICTSSSGKNCTTTKEVTNSGTSTFYVKVPAGSLTAGAAVTISIKGANSSTYPSILRYKGTSYVDSTQKLIVPTKVSISRITKQSYNLTVPDLTQHMIKVIKVDEHGDELLGSRLALYKVNPTTEKEELLKQNANGNGEIIYTSPKTTTENDDFFEHNYYVKELASPNGYALNNDLLPIDTSALSKNNTETCYFTEGEEFEKVDASRCNFDNYDYVCLNSKGEVTDKVTVEDNCEVLEEPTPEPEIPTPTPGAGGEEGEPTTQEETNPEGEGGDNTGTEGGEGTTEPKPEEPAEPVETYEKVCYSKSEAKSVDASYCTDKEKYTKVQTSNGNITVIKTNVLNKVYISKTDMTGDKEVPGASLRICTKENYEKDKLDCETAKTIKDVEMSWISTSKPREIQGIPTGKYVIIEVLPPNGYELVTSVTEFEVDDNGKVTSNKKDITKETPIVIKNQINHITISKQDISTKKELPGATLSICLTYKNEETNKIELEIDEVTGDCIPAILVGGKTATWTSTDKPYKIEGLAPGTYYLVENIAPKNYSTAESILFTITKEGKVLDTNGKDVANNKIEMKDEPLKQVPTGDLPLIAIITIGLVGLATGVICYHYSTKKYNLI